MSRASYGADVFSPIKSNVSFIDDHLSAGVESDFFDHWREPYGATGNSEIKKKNPFIPFLHTDEASSRDHLQSTFKIDSTVEKKNKKNSSLEANFAHVTTRRSLHKGKKELAESRESQLTRNDNVSKTRKKIHATGTEANSNKELPLSKTKQNASSVSPSNSTDTNKDLLPGKTKQNKDPGQSLVIPIDSKKELPFNKMKQNKDTALSSVIPADSNKEIPFSKMKQNKDYTTSLAIPSDSNKELPSNKMKHNKSSLTSLVTSSNSNKELPSNEIKQSKDSATSLVNLADSKKDLLLSKIKQSKDSYSPSLASLAEEQPERSPSFNADVGSMNNNCNNLGSSKVQIETHTGLSKTDTTSIKSHFKSKKSGKDSEASLNQYTFIEKSVITSDCDQDNLRSSEKMDPDVENRGESVATENSNAGSGSSVTVSKPEQIQANIIEKLVRDAVSFEFDGIRQMLYLQHLQLLKYIDRNAVNYDLQKTIEELVEENRRLKNIIAHQSS